MKYNTDFDFYSVGRASILITNQQDAAPRNKGSNVQGKKLYLYFTMRTMVIANKESKYLEVMENSLFSTDGTPLVQCSSTWSIKQVERICGSSLFDDLLEDKDLSLKSFLLGDTEETRTRYRCNCVTTN